jgi:hypothetical protein
VALAIGYGRGGSVGGGFGLCQCLLLQISCLWLGAARTMFWAVCYKLCFICWCNGV